MAGLRCSLVICGFDAFVPKSAQDRTEFLVLINGFYSRQEFLTNETKDSSAPFLDKLAQFIYQQCLGGIQIPCSSAQR